MLKNTHCAAPPALSLCKAIIADFFTCSRGIHREISNSHIQNGTVARHSRCVLRIIADI